ncbi:MAG: thiamine-monophosphate kinase [Chloroflexi bacterium]|jgi:thiamine-monophosphate kinase|nr:MAG: thiamine-monophosphate kinase [Chloroflexota bacterium]
MRLYELGETGLLRRIESILADREVASALTAEATLVVGIGDDAAAWSVHGSNVSETLTTDTMVDNIHFSNANMSWRDVGWRSMVANLSDIAAMGGVPSLALVTLGLPGSTLVEDVEDVYKGLVDACRAYEVTIAGGDLVTSPTFFISITMSGLQSGEMLLRSSANVGDLVAVTGPLGLSRGGLEVLSRGDTGRDEYAQRLVEAHRHPKPRLPEGRMLVQGGVRAALDVSDGLVGDLKKMMLASNLAANIIAKNVKIDPALNAIYGTSAIDLALNGGEDYELLFAAPYKTIEQIKTVLPHVNIVGEVVAGLPGIVTVKHDQGETIHDGRFGWEHFRQ